MYKERAISMGMPALNEETHIVEAMPPFVNHTVIVDRTPSSPERLRGA